MSQDQFSALHEVKINLIPSILGTALLEPATQPRATGLSRRLMRRRELRLQGSAGFFLQKIYHGDELKRPIVCALRTKTTKHGAWMSVSNVSKTKWTAKGSM